MLARSELWRLTTLLIIPVTQGQIVLHQLTPWQKEELRSMM